MKKRLVKVLAISLLAVLAVMMLASCSTYSKIEKNLKEVGYEVVEDENDTANKIVAEISDGENGSKLSVTVHVFKNSSGVIPKWALVLEFSSEGDVNKAIEESATIKGILTDAQKSDYINGNCLLIPLTITDADTVKEAFKK